MAEKTLDGKKVIMAIPPTQFREEEFFEPKRILEEEGAAVTAASTAARPCRGMRGDTVEAQAAVADLKAEDYDALVICGGASVPRFFWSDKKLQELAAAMSGHGKIVGAISLSTVVLARAKLLTGRKATVYFLPQAIDELKTAGASYVQQGLIVEGNIIMAEGPPDAARFGEAIRDMLAETRAIGSNP